MKTKLERNQDRAKRIRFRIWELKLKNRIFSRKTAAVLFLWLVVILYAQSTYAQRNFISIVGSSTVYPFSTVVAENFGRSTNFATPKIESTGSGGGLKLFCTGLGVQTPDITNSSRRITQSEIDDCKSNGVTNIIEVNIGYDGIELANANTSPVYKLTRTQIFLALAKNIPYNNTFIPNPYERWVTLIPVYLRAE